MDSSQIDHLKRVMNQVKLGSLCTGVLSFSIMWLFPGKLVILGGALLAYASYECFTLAGNIQEIYSGVISEMQAKISKGLLLQKLTRGAPVSEMALGSLDQDELHKRFFPRQ